MRPLLFNIILAGMLLIPSQSLFAQCKVKPIVKNCMSLLGDYVYDSYALKKISYSSKPKKETLEFSVFSDEQYKLVFGKTVLPQEIGITIYDKPASKKNRKIVYFDESGKKDNFVFDFQPKETGTYYIEYSIPAANAPHEDGCFVILIGIKD